MTTYTVYFNTDGNPKDHKIVDTDWEIEAENFNAAEIIVVKKAKEDGFYNDGYQYFARIERSGVEPNIFDIPSNFIYIDMYDSNV